MTVSTPPEPVGAIDDFVAKFERAHVDGLQPNLHEFLPAEGHPLFVRVVRELARVELEYGWNRGSPKSIADYRREYADVFSDSDALAEIAFEEFRQRRSRGQSVSAQEYARCYGIDVDHWPTDSVGLAPTMAATSPDLSPLSINTEAADAKPALVTADSAELLAASLIYRRLRARTDSDQAVAESLRWSPTVSADAVELFQATHRSNPEAAGKLAESTAEMPEVGDVFVGFRLIGELGRGAFGRVFLAQQGELANRPVALKVSTDFEGESQTLAQLQHTNIVPIYSVHRKGPFQAVCMPYFGGTTLVDVLRGLRTDSMPVSGKYFVSTLNNRRSHTHDEPSQRSGQPESVDSLRFRGASPRATIAPPGRAEAHPTLHRLEVSSYVEAVLWLMARLADGLAHAHERGVVHRDLKPANILLTDDGQPMLLDFNLSANLLIHTSAAAARIGGTLPYMSPEQLEAFQNVKTPVDGRTDIYSLGLVVYQLLIGRYPFSSHKGALKTVLPAMLAERFQMKPTLRDRNRAVTPATEAIIQKCLAPNPAERYRSAQELVEDLDRQLNHQPLKYAPEPSWRERARKWSRRHPVLTSSTTVGIIAAVVLAAGASTAYSLWNRHLTSLAAERKDQARLLAAENLQQLRRAKNTQQALLRSSDRSSLQHLSSATESSLAAYGVLTNPDWQKATIVSELPETDQIALRRDVAEMLMTWSEAERGIALSEPSGGERTAHLTKAMSLNSHADLCLDPADRGKGFWQQRASLAQLLGLPDAATLADRAARASVTNARDHFTLARELVKQHEFKRAIPLLAETTRLDPQHFWAWHYLGNCHFELLNFSEALTCYSACRGLNPDPSVKYFPHYHLALVNAAQGRLAAALDDVNRSIACLSALPPDVAAIEQSKPYLLKARILAGQKNPTSALAALTSGLTAAPQSMELLFERANLRRACGDVAGADADRAEALKIPPATEIGWNVRGLGRLPADPVAALADFETALKINPQFHEALQNKAHVLSEHLDRPAEALAALDLLIIQYPGYVRARIGRAVLYARKGQREPALTDVRESLARDRSAGTLYQAANVFALTSRQVASDRDKVIPLLAAALWGGFGLDVVDTDSDMDPVRESPAFRGLIAVVRELEAQIPRNSN